MASEGFSTRTGAAFAIAEHEFDLGGTRLVRVRGTVVDVDLDGETAGTGAGEVSFVATIEDSADGSSWAAPAALLGAVGVDVADNMVADTLFHDDAYIVRRFVRVNGQIEADAALYAGGNAPWADVTFDVELV